MGPPTMAAVKTSLSMGCNLRNWLRNKPIVRTAAITVICEGWKVPTPGTSITLTAAGASGTPSYQFKWWVFGATGWTVLQDWNSAATYIWTPATANPQGVVEVWGRSAGNSANAPEKWVDLPYVIQ